MGWVVGVAMEHGVHIGWGASRGVCRGLLSPHLVKVLYTSVVLQGGLERRGHFTLLQLVPVDARKECMLLDSCTAIRAASQALACLSCQQPLQQTLSMAAKEGCKYTDQLKS